MSDDIQAPTTNDSINPELETSYQTANKIKQQVEQVLIGQSDVLQQALVCLFASGHLLLEGVPGIGKTLLVRALSKSFGGDFSRIQFTPDLMPSDVTGHAVYDPKSEKFRIRKGPAFTNLLLADEINRAPAKTQASLLEVMQEQQITIEGNAYHTDKPFMVMATQNPLEQEGTYPLPEAELDRFLMKVYMEYPEQDDEVLLVKKITTGQISNTALLDMVQEVATPEDIIKGQQIASKVEVDDSLFDYAVRIVAATRKWPGIRMGASPRASLALIRCSRALAMLNRQSFVTPDEIKQVAAPIIRHRIQLSAELEIEGISVDDVIKDILNQVEAPRQ
ncbi:MAG: MoxR family ATPase [Gammaproteobacteria bacterium]|nr:MoxR family ATPase [Gammaproteobacteria bacterium]